jgi:hypothetical protein
MAVDSTRYGSLTYVRGPGVPDLDGSQDAWVASTGTVDPKEIGRLGAALGISGDVHETSGGWQMGDGDGAGPVLSVADGAGNSWSFNDVGATTTGVVCSGSASSPMPGDVGSPTTFATTTTIVSDCPAPAPPTGLPDQAGAEAEARRILGAAGVDLDGAVVTATADQWSASVVVSPQLDGIPTSGFDTTIAFGDGGKVAYAAGWLGQPERGDAYPLIGVDAAIARLQQGTDLIGPPMMTSTDRFVAVPEMATSETAVGAPPPTTVPVKPEQPATPGPSTTMATSVPYEDPGSCEGYAQHGPPAALDQGADTPQTSAPQPSNGTTESSSGSGCAIPPDPHPGPTYVPELNPPRTITITSASLELAAVAGSDGSLWLVPAYRLTSDDMGTWDVLAVDESFIAPVPDVPVPQPGIDDGTGFSTPGSAVPGTVVPETVPPTTVTTSTLVPNGPNAPDPAGG